MLTGACAALLASALLVAASPIDLAIFLVGLAAFTAPGWPLSRWFAGSGRDFWSRLVVALVLGYLAGALLVVSLRAAGIASPFACFAARWRSRPSSIASCRGAAPASFSWPGSSGATWPPSASCG